MIGLKRGTVKLVPHNPEWDELFHAEKVKLLQALGGLAIDIQHVGSTAIPTIPAKPIIDIAVLVKSLEQVGEYIAKIEALEYRKKRENRPERLFFTKGPEENRIVYLHIGDENTDYIKDMVVFRDYLMQNPDEAKRYAELKEALVEKFADNREPYTSAKEKFVQEVVERAKSPHDIFYKTAKSARKRIVEIPISAKGIVFEGNSVWLRKNERNEWELPGGKVDIGEQPIQTVIREIQEELGFEIEIVKIVHAWVYRINQSNDESGGVLVLCYLCKLLAKTGGFETESEAGKAEFRKFPINEINQLNMPEFYKEAIRIASGIRVG